MRDFDDIFWDIIYGPYVLPAAVFGGYYEIVAIDFNFFGRGNDRFQFQAGRGRG